MQLRISKITVLFIRHQNQLLELVFNRRVALIRGYYLIFILNVTVS